MTFEAVLNIDRPGQGRTGRLFLVAAPAERIPPGVVNLIVIRATFTYVS